MAVYKIEGCQWNCFPDTTVLINKMDIRDQAELDSVEKQITLLRGQRQNTETFHHSAGKVYRQGHRF